ncbi:hypothetical protein OHB37_19450 [Streptomyces albidoflavus]|uniref:hypothetical protein n=1 Tax=Streptomyces TaxID=1883 RepID=UPI00101F5F55|nr:MULTISPECIES: hypothetical protein [Streptomyces]MBT2879067.1 hypothetical protein [Streptomyces sp. McG6]MBT2886047.1 hypothetical protein [Streptomyces sp. McG5]MBT2891760.1 hypothetical protein [Streptomyces sp. McG2]WSB16208.1 hypothetical protein OHB37_19450 [Streptomyces albidoflavus]
MLTHGRESLLKLADRCVALSLSPVMGWSCDKWILDNDDVDIAVEIYQDLLSGDSTEQAVDALASAGVDLDSLLQAPGEGNERITRSDITELIAAASVISLDGWLAEELCMPNVPKMARKKSDSGIDILAVRLDASPEMTLSSADVLLIVSVKHSVPKDNSAYSLRYKLVKSLSDDLTLPYLASQLRVLNAKLQEQGMTKERASKVYLFLAPSTDQNRSIIGVGLVAPDLEDSLSEELQNLPDTDGQARHFRSVIIPGLQTLHERCP